MISALQMSRVNLGDDPLFSVPCIEKVFPELTAHRGLFTVFSAVHSAFLWITEKQSSPAGGAVSLAS